MENLKSFNFAVNSFAVNNSCEYKELTIDLQSKIHHSLLRITDDQS
jgi:hypothetical protein